MKGFILFFVAIFVLLVGCQNPITVVDKDGIANDTVLSPPMQYEVSTSGMRIINIRFDTAVDRISAETVINYSVKNNKTATVFVQSAKLLDDKKTVQLFLSAGMYNDLIRDCIEVKNIQNVGQTATINTTTKEFVMRDITVPIVVSVEALGSKAIRVNFSEAIQGIANNSFRIDDKILNPVTSELTTEMSNVTVTYPDGDDYTKALISFANPVSVGAHTLIVSCNSTLTDYNVTTDGTANTNVMQSAGYVITFSVDVSVPMLSSVEVLSQNKARYTFTKDIQTPSEKAFFWSTSANQTSGTFANKVTKVSDNVYEVVWPSAINIGNIYFYAGTISDKVIDYSENSISPLPSSKVAVVITDTTPSLYSVSMDIDSNNAVIVYFNKDVDMISAQNSFNYTFKTADGVILSSTTGGKGIDNDGHPALFNPVQQINNLKKVVIALGGAYQDRNPLPAGTYQLSVSGVKTSAGTSPMQTQTFTFTVLNL